MSTAPVENLELRALEQRERIQRTALELVSKVDRTKQKLNVEYMVREHLGSAVAAAGTVAFLLGFAVVGIFLPSRR